MKPSGPVGFAALLARMPRRFVAQARAVEERARRRREAQKKRFEREIARAEEARQAAKDEWPDTVATFNPRWTGTENAP